eukprot:315760-Pleurochrysis_carterae.AAC.1
MEQAAPREERRGKGTAVINALALLAGSLPVSYARPLRLIRFRHLGLSASPRNYYVVTKLENRKVQRKGAPALASSVFRVTMR